MRLTGGEPLVRRGIVTLVSSLSRHLASGALKELTLTTNGSQLQKYAAELKANGIRRINISLDTLNADRFSAITRWGNLENVMAGIDAAQAQGLEIKINAVALKGVNEDEIVNLLEWAHGRGMDLTVIEVMPLGDVDEIASRSVPAAIDRAGEIGGAIYARGHRLSYGRACPLCTCKGNRRAAGLYYATYP